MVEIVKDLWRSSGPAALHKQRHPEQAVQVHVWAVSEHLQGGRLHRLFGQPGLVLWTLKKCFLVFTWNLPCSSLCPLPLFLTLGTAEECTPLSFQPPFRYIYMLIITLMSLLFSRPKNSISLSLLSYKRCSSLCTVAIHWTFLVFCTGYI